jgi:hypothetical protein
MVKGDPDASDNTVRAAVISGVAVVLAAFVGLLGGNSGFAKDVLPGSPVSTVTSTVIVTVTQPPVTVTVSAGSGSTDPGPDGIPEPGTLLALADPANASFVAASHQVDTKDNISINGRIYPWGFVGVVCGANSIKSPCPSSALPRVAINLGRAYAHFKARIGATDQSSSGTTADVSLIADGKPVFHKAVSLGTSEDVNLPVSGVLRLELQVTSQHANMAVAVGGPTAMP